MLFSKYGQVYINIQNYLWASIYERNAEILIIIAYFIKSITIFKDLIYDESPVQCPLSLHCCIDWEEPQTKKGYIIINVMKSCGK
jgi:hypothetical protein